MKRFAVVLSAALIAGCSGSLSPTSQSALPHRLGNVSGSNQIKHVVIIVQENRSFDN
ncbi:MAG: hypothetical protein JO277_03965, partial [Candidatus Eremiobacteraeota bacterium]|nr:hypothetical protein [Candidatus Eremiobacteraeota bacterium]